MGAKERIIAMCCRATESNIGIRARSIVVRIFESGLFAVVNCSASAAPIIKCRMLLHHWQMREKAEEKNEIIFSLQISMALDLSAAFEHMQRWTMRRTTRPWTSTRIAKMDVVVVDADNKWQ